MSNIDDTHKIDGKEPTHENCEPFDNYEKLYLNDIFVQKIEFEKHKLQQEEEFEAYKQNMNENYFEINEKLQKHQNFLNTLSTVLSYLSKYVLATIIGYFLLRALDMLTK